MTENSIFRLCYVSGCWAWFTTQAVKDQRGDGWRKVPYEHNAGEPYGPTWHNHPTNLNSPHRGKAKPGELCRCESCLKDWNDDGAPKWELFKVAFEADLEQPANGYGNSSYSVESINAGAVAWLHSSGKSPPIVIHGGDTMQEFCDKIKEAGGTVYYPMTEQ